MVSVSYTHLLASRGYEGIGSDIAPEYSGVQDNTAVTKMPYISLDITNKEAVNQILETTCPDVVIDVYKRQLQSTPIQNTLSLSSR